jgi:hypothetical protein
MRQGDPAETSLAAGEAAHVVLRELPEGGIRREVQAVLPALR